jgi:hypothetical protein
MNKNCIFRNVSGLMLAGILITSCSESDKKQTAEKEAPKIFQSIAVSKNFLENNEDSYWVDAGDYTSDGKPDLIAYGLGAWKQGEGPIISPVYLYRNPGKFGPDGEQLWKRQLIDTVITPVGMNHADVNKDGHLDIILTDKYGYNIQDCLPEGGNIFWLENPGPSEKDTVIWKRHRIGRTVAQHRVAVGKFTNNENEQIITLPVVGECGDIYTPISVKLYDRPKNVSNAKKWKETLINHKNFVLIHDFAVKRNPELSDYDVLLVGSREGISWLYYGRDKKWHVDNVSEGETDLHDFDSTKFKFKGTNTADIGRIKGKPNQFLASLEPFHGGTVCVYNNVKGKWNRKVLNRYGHVDHLGFGVGHFVITEDFDKDVLMNSLLHFQKNRKVFCIAN